VALQRPRLTLLAGGIVAVGGAIGLSVLLEISAGAFWLNVVAGNANPFDPAQLVNYVTNFALLHCVLVVTALAEAVWLVRQRNRVMAARPRTTGRVAGSRADARRSARRRGNRRADPRGTRARLVRGSELRRCRGTGRRWQCHAPAQPVPVWPLGSQPARGRI